jgi:putative transcriptional regulator
MFRPIPRHGIAKSFTWVAILVLFIGSLYAKPSSRAADTEPSIAGRLLIATGEMKDPRFDEAVIYLVKHDSEGSLGLIINRPIAHGAIDDLLKGFGVEGKGSNREIVIHYGGPVSSRQGFLLHSDDVTLENSIRATDGIVMTSDIKIIEAIALGKGPRQFMLALGYTGWAPGQLEAELKANSWFVISADKSFIFGEDAEQKWRRAMDKRQIPL